MSRSGGYSLVEVLIAAAIVALGIGAAAVLAMSTVSQQEGSAAVVRALNYQEQACRLWQLGVATNHIAAILPQESSVSLPSFTVSTTNIPNVGDVQRAVCTVVITAGSRIGATTAQTNTNIVIRPSIR